jgi:hypothetical protein
MTNQEDVRCVIFRKGSEQRKRQQRNLVVAVTRNQVKDVPSAAGKYYCPMHCEGDKV